MADRDIEANIIGHIVSHESYSEGIEVSGYPSNIDSTITLTGLQPDMQVEITFIAVDFFSDEANSCPDFLEITEVVQVANREPLPKVCGRKASDSKRLKSVVTTSDRIVFHFKTGILNFGHNGFILRYKIIDSSTAAGGTTLKNKLASGSFESISISIE